MSTPSLPPSLPASDVATRPGSAVLAFWLDVVIGALTLLSVSLFAGIGWGLYRGAMIGMSAAQAGVPTPSGDAITAAIGQPGALAQLLMALLSTSSAALLLYFWRRRASSAERQFSHQQIRRGSTWGLIVLTALGVFTATSLISWLGKQVGIEPVPTNLPLMQEAMSRFPLFLAVFAVVLAPAYEELLFRRVLFARLWAAGRPVLGMVLSSLAFAFLHEIPGTNDREIAQTLQLWLVYGGMGAAFAWLYQRTGTLWAPIIVHGINNAIALSVLYLGTIN